MVLADYGEFVEPGPENWPETGIRFFVRRGFVLVRDGYAEPARRLLEVAEMRPRGGDWGSEERPEDEPVDGDIAYGVRWMRLGPGVSVFHALRTIQDGVRDRANPRRRVVQGLGADAAAPEYLLHISDHAKICSATEPHYVSPGSSPDPAVSKDRCAGQGIRVLVIDTGFDPAAAELPWMRGVTGDPDPGVGATPLPRYAGHGTFIAGIIRAVAPAAEVIVRTGFPAPVAVLTSPLRPPKWINSATPAGTAFEGQLAMALERFLIEDDPDVINLSAGTLTENVQHLLMLNAFHDNVLRRHKGLVIVAAAGNDSTRSHFWPAAAPWAVGVGALSADHRTRADFTNFGAWVDVYAPGERLINAFPTGVYRYTEPPERGQTRNFAGMAAWSGTSFAAPVVAGLIAARMSRTGENGRTAAAALIALAHTDALPGVGATLVPGGRRECGETRHRERRCSCGAPCGDG
jgi:hypothetical protein